MISHMTMPPVLLLIFNRPNTTREVMASIRAARPARLYVAADGPREGRAAEVVRCAEARLIAGEVDWPCEVRTLFRENNLGLRLAVSGALDWFFEQESDGIILEDDCVPSQSFFKYCEVLLDRYRDDDRIMSVSGDNFQHGRKITNDSYYFSSWFHCWGWATWRRAWALYDRDMDAWPAFKTAGGLRRYSNGLPAFEEYWTDIFDRAAANKIDSWAYRFLLSCWVNDGMGILPERNLVSNIGFGPGATHTTDAGSREAGIPATDLTFPLRHPSSVERNVPADDYEFRRVIPPQNPARRVSLRNRLRIRTRLRDALKRIVG